MAVRRLLDSLQRPGIASRQARVVAMVEGCTFAVCLDFYNTPREAEFPRTQVGELVYQAKYQESDDAVSKLARGAKRFVVGNPLFEKAEGIAAVPGSRKGSGASPLLGMVADEIAGQLSVPRIALQRRQGTVKAQKNIDPDEGDDPDANQNGTMASGTAPSSVLVIDDLMRHGSSLREAARALHKQGASNVMALVLAKDLKGTRRYVFPGG